MRFHPRSHASLVFQGLVPTLALLLGGCEQSSSTETASEASQAGASTATPEDGGEAAEHVRENPGAPLVFTTPEGWRSTTPSSSMRKAQYVLPAENGDPEDAELVVYQFGERAGPLQANIDRWVGQFEQPDGSPSNERLVVSTRRVRGMEITLVDIRGTYRAESFPGSGERVNKPAMRMLAAVIESDHGPYYCKLVGPERTVDHWEGSFQSFLSDVR